MLALWAAAALASAPDGGVDRASGRDPRTVARRDGGAGSRDGGAPRPGGTRDGGARGGGPVDGGRREAAPGAADGALSAAECDRLVLAIVVLSVNEAFAKDPEAQRLPPAQRAAAARLARQQALAEPGLERLKAACRARYTRAQERCILSAATMDGVDACSR